MTYVDVTRENIRILNNALSHAKHAKREIDALSARATQIDNIKIQAGAFLAEIQSSLQLMKSILRLAKEMSHD